MSDTNVIEMHLTVDNVYEQDNAVWSRLRRNVGKESTHMNDARELWPAIAADMARLREKHSADIEFGAALVMHEIEYSKNNRAAFVKLGRILNSALVDAMGLNQTRSPELLAKWVKEKAGSDDYYAEIGFRNSETDNQLLPEPEKAPEPPAIEPEPMKTEDQTSQKTEKKLITKRKATTKNVLCDHYTNQGWERICNHLPKTSDRKLLAAAVSSGALGESNPIKNNSLRFGIREIFIDYPLRWRYQGVVGESLIRRLDEIIDHHTRCGDDLSKGNCNKVAEEIRIEKIPTQVKSIYTAPAEPSGISHSEAKPANVQDIVVAGVLIWSETETKGHLYEDAWNSYQLFTRMVNDLPHDSRHHWIRGSKSLGKFMHNITLDSACDVWTRMATAACDDLAMYVTDTHGAEPATNHA